MKKLICLTAVLLLMSAIFTGCAGSGSGAYYKYSSEFYDTFDTVVTVTAYAKNDEAFDDILSTTYDTFLRMHQLFDIYHEYDGVNNIKTINDNAGIAPVKVDPAIIDMLKLAREWCLKTDGAVNVALGPVLSIWHDYREAGIADPDSAQLPPMEDLQQASRYTDIDDVVIDEQASTVYLPDSHMSLDVGAVAKGYATQAAADQLIAKGYDSVLINAGGNVRAIGAPRDGVRGKWSVGIRNPDNPSDSSTDDASLLDVACVTDASVVSSGTYERYYIVDGVSYHHLIDPATLMPANDYKATTVITEDSALADLLSTALFLMPPEKSLEFVQGLDGVEALWVMPDNELVYSSGMKAMLRDIGGASCD